MSCDILEQYSAIYDPGIPDYIFFFPFWITSTLIAILLLMMKKKSIKETVMGALLAECIFIIFCSTVIYRETLPEPHSNFMPFWSYKAIGEGDDMCFVEVFLNIILFIPSWFLGLRFKKNEQIVEGGVLGMYYLMYYRMFTALVAKRGL